MSNEAVGAYISSVTFNNGARLNVNADDIVVFVGPNNAGKSQSLRDIYFLAARQMQNVVISNIEVNKYPKKIESLLETLSEGIKTHNYTQYQFLQWSLTFNDNTEQRFQQCLDYGGFRELFIANLNTTNRLQICSPAQIIN